MGLKSILTWAVKGNPWEVEQPPAPNGHHGNGHSNGHARPDDADLAGVPAPRANAPAASMIEAKPIGAPGGSQASIPTELLESVARHDAESAELLRRLVAGLDRLHDQVRVLAERVPQAAPDRAPESPGTGVAEAIREGAKTNTRAIADLNAALAAQHQSLLRAIETLPASLAPGQSEAGVRGGLPAIDPATMERLAAGAEALPLLREHSQRLLDTCARLSDTVRGLSASSDANAGEMRKALDRLAQSHAEASGANASALRQAAESFAGAAAHMNTIAKGVGGSTERIGDILADVRTATSTREAQVADFARRVSTWTLAAFVFCGLSFVLALVALVLRAFA